MRADQERVLALAVEWQRAVEDYACRKEGDDRDVLHRFQRMHKAENALAWAVRGLPEFKGGAGA